MKSNSLTILLGRIAFNAGITFQQNSQIELARANKSLNTIEVHPKMYDLEIPLAVFIVYHEIGHIKHDTQNEVIADSHAYNSMKAIVGEEMAQCGVDLFLDQFDDKLTDQRWNHLVDLLDPMD